MAVCRIYEVAGATLEQYDAVNDKVPEQMPPEAHYHVAGAAGGTLYVIEVWDSREDIERFMQGPLGPAMEEVGVPEPKITEFEVHNEESRA
jgi:hypothetical protein